MSTFHTKLSDHQHLSLNSGEDKTCRLPWAIAGRMAVVIPTLDATG